MEEMTVGEIIAFDGRFRRHTAQPANAQPVEAARKWGTFGDNQHSRRALLRMLLLGGSFRAVARKHPAGEVGLTQDVREALLGDEPPAKLRRAA